MKQSRYCSIAASTVTAFALCLLIASPTSVRANAIYDAITLVNLDITHFANDSGVLDFRPNDLMITGDAFVIDEGQIIEQQAIAEKFASATVNGFDLNVLGIGDGLSQEALVTGEATSGTATSFAITQGLFAISNFSLSESYTIGFETIWSYLANSNVTNRDFEFATAESGIFLESIENGSLLDFTIISDSEFVDGLITNQDIHSFSIQVAPGAFDILTLTSRAIGAATATSFVSEPSILALLGIGLLSTVLVRRSNTPHRLRP